MNDLVHKYNQSGPRYTSYPPVPFWKNNINADEWMRSLAKTVIDEKQNGISIYIHLPFCESLCTYCGCNTRITVNHSVEIPYLDAVLMEWEMYKAILPDDTIISEIHLGGGTPTFFSASNLHYLVSNILKDFRTSDDPQFSIEGHPNSTSAEQLKTLYSLGFKRISYGIQDFDKVVQKAIHRFQTFEQVKKVTMLARNSGFNSVNYDLIYGLPFQTIQSIETTFRQVLELKPDRIAFYGYAHVPWVKPGQRSYSDADLPSPEERLEMYETGRKILEDEGYIEIGMDHFALETDSLYKAQTTGRLNRNFMGYTDSNSKIIVALGVSSISFNGEYYAQNVKSVEEYYDVLKRGDLPVFRGHKMTEEEKRTGQHIHNLMCRFETQLSFSETEKYRDIIPQLKDMQNDGILIFDNGRISVTNTGRRFVRNICMAIDPLLKEKAGKNIFSATV